MDRTLMAFVALHMQDSCPNGLSNRLSPTVAHSASYAVLVDRKRVSQAAVDRPRRLPD